MYRKERAVSLVFRERVIQVSDLHFLVESKRYPGKDKPSRCYFIKWQRSGMLRCGCYHGRNHLGIDDYCSHILAVMLSVGLKARSTQHLALRDAVIMKDKQDIPTRGNESPAHKKAKERVYQVMTQRGWICNYECEFRTYNPISKILNKYPYCVDVVCASKDNKTVVGIELNKESTGGGHGSKISIPKDRNRAQEIEEQYHIKIVAFNIYHLKSASDYEIVWEVYRALGLSKPV